MNRNSIELGFEEAWPFVRKMSTVYANHVPKLFLSLHDEEGSLEILYDGMIV